MESALAAVRKVLNRINSQYWNSEVDFSEFLALGDAESLVNYLKFAVDAEERQRNRRQ